MLKRSSLSFYATPSLPPSPSENPKIMGVCASTPTSTKSRGGGAPRPDAIGRPTSSIVIDADGRMQELKRPTQSKHITSQNPNHFLCNSETMSIGTCLTHVPDEEELQPGQIYFLLPLRQTQKPLSLPDLCDLAIKASSAMARDGGRLTSKLNFP
ncbi:unnamed protein product [Malus baccata var. baccata]